jgi:Leucine-rich repeat (LRR) protein
MKRVFFLILLMGFKVGHSQLLDSLALDTMKAFTSIEAAKANPDKVIKLVLIKKKLTEVPPEIRQFKNLQYLDLSRNKIKRIPDWIGELTSIQTLVLSHNDIDTLTEHIGFLLHLKYFIMSRDPLDAIPNAIGDLQELRVLDMWGDNIGYFPSSFSKLNNLKYFDVRDILINDQEQATIKSYLPYTNIYFSPSCSCKEQ